MSTVTPPFKVLIAGGSISGLTLALALEHAGIDYELFEKGDIDNDLGASIAVNASSNRILDQLGVYESIEPIVTGLIRSYRIDGKTGHTILDKNFYQGIQDELRWPWYFIERRILIQKIYNRIKDKSKIHSRLAVQEYEEDADKITITTSGGTFYTGDILVGADGIHSRVRTLIAKRIEKIDEPLSKELNNSFVTEFQVLYSISNHDPNANWLPDAKTVILPYGDHCSGFVTKARQDCVFWVLINKVPRTEYAKHLRYTDEDAQNLIKEHGDLLVVPGHTMRELWDTRITATLVPMEDGVAKKWSHGRAILIGDSIHKFTINAGLGGVLAIEAVAQLSNRIVSLVKQNPHPTQQDVTSLFEDFDRAHRPRTEIAHRYSVFMTRLESQDNWFFTFYSRYIMPRQSDKQIGQAPVEWALTAPWLEFLPLPERDIEILVKSKKEIEDRGARNSTITWSLVGTGLALATTALIWGWRLKRV